MSSSNADRTYRERSVDEALEEHDTRISRLEKGALIAIGYGLHDGGTLVSALFQLV